MPVAFPQDRTVVVTGAASARGIGRVLAARLAAQGWHVAALDTDGAAVATLAERLAAEHGVRALGVGVDVTDRAAVHAAVDQIEADLPQVVGLANVAGISSPTPFLEETAEGWNRVLAVNLTGVFTVTQRVAAAMVRGGVGRIVSISSLSFQRGGGTYSKSAYSASKGGVVGLTRSIARELGPYGITANCVSPGPVDTDIMGGTLSPERKDELGQGTLVGRVATPDDVTAVVAFLLSAEAGNITGATYDTNGGMHMQ